MGHMLVLHYRKNEAAVRYARGSFLFMGAKQYGETRNLVITSDQVYNNKTGCMFIGYTNVLGAAQSNTCHGRNQSCPYIHIKR